MGLDHARLVTQGSRETHCICDGTKCPVAFNRVTPFLWPRTLADDGSCPMTLGETGFWPKTLAEDLSWSRAPAGLFLGEDSSQERGNRRRQRRRRRRRHDDRDDERRPGGAMSHHVRATRHMQFSTFARPRGVTVSTLDSESSDRGSNPREASTQSE